MDASVSLFETPGLKTKAKFMGEEREEEDYHNLPYGQLCLLSEEKTKQNRRVEKRAGNRERRGE